MQSRCSHPFSSHLNVKLINHRICPLCLITYHILQIRKSQADLSARGGIFASKQRVMDECEEIGGRNPMAPQAKKHRECQQKWRAVKLAALSDIVGLEEMERKMSEDKDFDVDKEHKECRVLVREGLEKWRNGKESMLRLPGYDDPKSEDASSPNDLESSPKATNDRSPEDTPLPPGEDLDLVCTPPAAKSLCFADLATVSADGKPPSQQPHNIHTEADKSRGTHVFNRLSSGYRPKTWASPEGCEKEETSWHRKNVVEVDGVLKVKTPKMLLDEYHSKKRVLA
jgi:hypothetical protein